jgi:hypothetical protein
MTLTAMMLSPGSKPSMIMADVPNPSLNDPLLMAIAVPFWSAWAIQRPLSEESNHWTAHQHSGGKHSIASFNEAGGWTLADVASRPKLDRTTHPGLSEKMVAHRW